MTHKMHKRISWWTCGIAGVVAAYVTGEVLGQSLGRVWFAGISVGGLAGIAMWGWIKNRLPS